VKIVPQWTEELTELTTGQLDEVCFDEVFTFYQSTFADRKPLSANSELSVKNPPVKQLKPTDKENDRSLV
jgi:hypothetical protein